MFDSKELNDRFIKAVEQYAASAAKTAEVNREVLALLKDMLEVFEPLMRAAAKQMQELDA